MDELETAFRTALARPLQPDCIFMAALDPAPVVTSYPYRTSNGNPILL